jgi:hypothetical protein
MLIIVACGDSYINKTFDHVENIVARQPDNALILLDSIKNPLKSMAQQAQYAILTTYAKDLTEDDISKDNAIIYVIDYLETTNNPKYLAFAKYYLGRIYQAHGNNEKTLELYLNAKGIAENSKYDNLNELIASYIGQQYYYQGKIF